MATFGLPVSCARCGGDVTIRQSVAVDHGTAANAVLVCDCGAEWFIAIQMRALNTVRRQAA